MRTNMGNRFGAMDAVAEAPNDNDIGGADCRRLRPRVLGLGCHSGFGVAA
jgi:hypothetical protein